MENDKAYLALLRYFEKKEPEYIPIFKASYQSIIDRHEALRAENEKHVIWRANESR